MKKMVLNTCSKNTELSNEGNTLCRFVISSFCIPNYYMQFLVTFVSSNSQIMSVNLESLPVSAMNHDFMVQPGSSV